MKIFGIGLSRTGTRSFARGLEHLGFSAGHFDKSIRSVRLEGGSILPDFEQVEPWDALVDIPIAAIYRDLADRYPQARFVLTVREREAWLASCQRHLSRDNSDYLERHGIDRDLVMAIRRSIYGRTDFNSADFEEAYERHNLEVAEFFRGEPSRLLRFDPCAGEGWEKLCAFLGCPVPAMRFPHENRSARTGAR